jgi:hypothetical protein
MRALSSEDDFHFVREKIALGAIEVQCVSSSDQITDVFTKLGTKQIFERHYRNLNLCRVVEIKGVC